MFIFTRMYDSADFPKGRNLYFHFTWTNNHSVIKLNTTEKWSNFIPENPGKTFLLALNSLISSYATQEKGLLQHNVDFNDPNVRNYTPEKLK